MAFDEKRFNQLLCEYAEQFDEAFPICGCAYNDDDELIEIIQHCIDKNEPYVPNYDPNTDY